MAQNGHLHIAWGVTGAGHLMKDSFAAMKKIKAEGHSVTTFMSRAGEEVARMYGLNDFSEVSDGSYLNEVYLDSSQGSSFPKIGRFNVGRYDLFILMPATSNAFTLTFGAATNSPVSSSSSKALRADSAHRTSSPKNSNACGNAWQTGKPSSRRRRVFRNTLI